MRFPERPRRASFGRLCGVLLLPLAVHGVSGCGAGSYVWVDELTDPGALTARKGDYLIARGDLLDIRVYNQEALSVRGRVGPDGRIAIPLVGEIDAQGARSSELATEIATRLKSFLVAPSVTINVEEVEPVRIAVVGEVAQPGVFTILRGSGVLQALALAGGVTQYADRDRVFVLRIRPALGPIRIRFTYEGLTRGLGRGNSFTLESRDTVVVE